MTALRGIIVFLLLIANTVFATDPLAGLPVAVAEPSHDLREFTANYKVEVNHLPAPFKGTLSLTRDGEDAYTMDFRGGNLFLKASETSSFEGEGCRKRPIKHAFSASGFGIKKSRSTEFDWDTMQAHWKIKKDEGEFQITDRTWDELSMYLGMRCALIDGKNTMGLHLAKEDEMTIYYYEVLGEEEIKLPYKTLKAIKVKRLRNDNKRTTYIWLAPELDYLMVKMHHIENPTLQAELLLDKIQFADEQVEKKRGFFGF